MKRQTTETRNDSRQVSCADCGESYPREGLWYRGEIAHCASESRAFGAQLRGEAHHAASLHPKCWACGSSLGCRRCSGVAGELLCMGPQRPLNRREIVCHQGLGMVWATLEALLLHGLPHGQTIADYPANWNIEYARQNPIPDSGKVVDLRTFALKTLEART